MPIPKHFAADLSAPIIAAPMFLASGPDLVVEICRAGLIGTFPALNQRTTQGYVEWLTEIQRRLAASATQSGKKPAPFGVNLIVHKSNSRLQADLAATVEHKVPLVITSLGAARDVIDAVHSYGGIIFHDVINMKHARKAAEAGVDGLIAVAAGAGGHAGVMSPFAMVSEIGAFFNGTIILSGAMSHGREVAAAQMMGADLAYLGTRFLCTKESLAPRRYKEMVIDSTAGDIVYTAAISGVSGNFLRQSIAAAGRDPDNLTIDRTKTLDIENEVGSGSESKAWRDIWSAGQGVGGIEDIPEAAALCTRLTAEYRAATEQAATALRDFPSRT